MHDVNEEMEAGKGGKWIVDNLLLCDNVAIVSDDHEKQSLLMLVGKGPHSLDVSFEDGWGNTWTNNNVVIKRYWYEKLQHLGSYTYCFQNDKPFAYIFSH